MARRSKRATGRRRPREALAAACSAAIVAASCVCRADDGGRNVVVGAAAAGKPDASDPPDPNVGPPHTRRADLPYGLAFTIEDVLASGPICSGGPCILGSGGGIAGRIGFRPSERLYLGGTYE